MGRPGSSGGPTTDVQTRTVPQRWCGTWAGGTTAVEHGEQTQVRVQIHTQGRRNLRVLGAGLERSHVTQLASPWEKVV